MPASTSTRDSTARVSTATRSSTCSSRRRRSAAAGIRTELTIADCDNEITLEFSLETAQLRENSLFKIDTLLAALHRFRDALAAEAELRT
jgi:hypothetical protein